ncbi:MAG: nicotinate phosphoribosyltransferase [Actinomycetales bacterium]|nr:nicotinate phosphoribosyltransferase [Actinomycetales bacterium]
MPSTALLTDQYELTMVQAALRNGTARRRCVFEVFARRLPPGRRYGVVAGTARLLDAMTAFTFGEEELASLAERRVVDRETLDWLADYRFGGDVSGYPEGECFFPGSPVLVVEAPFAEAVLLETLALSILNHDCAVASAASRMVSAAHGRPCLEMGARRTHEEAAVAASRAAYLAGFSATSNLEAGRRHGVPTIGTAAHAFTLLHDDERAAFAAQVAALGTGTTLLVDTYDVPTGVATAVEVAGPSLGAVRLDSGDLLEQALAVRTQLDGLGARDTRIVVTSDLDEHAIAALASAPVDAYGVGTSLVTGSGAPTANLVYKLVAREAADGSMVGVAKRSHDKPTIAGRKDALRRYRPDGTAEAEVLRLTATAAAGTGERRLLHPLLRRGEPVGTDGLVEARARHAASLAELPATARQLSRGEPAIPTVVEHAPAPGGRMAG